MRYLKFLIGSTALVATMYSTTATAEAYGFKGAEIGSPISRTADNPKLECRQVSAPTADHICFLRQGESETIAGNPLDSIYYYYFQGRLTGITMTFEEVYFTDVVQALGQKYGQAVRDTDKIKTLGGKDYENIILRWQQAGQSIEARRYSARVDKSSVNISEDGAAQRIKQIREHSVTQPQNDL